MLVADGKLTQITSMNGKCSSQASACAFTTDGNALTVNAKGIGLLMQPT
jgi:hypothetical protein